MANDSAAGEEPISTKAAILPAEIVGDGSIKLFNKWSFEDVEVKDISLTYSITWLMLIPAITSNSAMQSTFPTRPAAMPQNVSAKPNVPLWND
jgi:hypothetical protein